VLVELQASAFDDNHGMPCTGELPRDCDAGRAGSDDAQVRIELSPSWPSLKSSSMNQRAAHIATSAIRRVSVRVSAHPSMNTRSPARKSADRRFTYYFGSIQDDLQLQSLAVDAPLYRKPAGSLSLL
jgi:hypothetical protein